jgi:3-oxoacyl-[acyl-carrier protein] reductase
LINCAGITNHKLLPRLSDQDIITTLNLNLTAPILLSKMCFKPLLHSNKGSSFTPTIINISSILATSSTIPGTSVYAASKAGLLGFTSSLAAELKGKIRVNSILPGLIQETNMGANANIDTIQKVSLEEVVKVTIDTILDESANGKHVVVD